MSSSRPGLQAGGGLGTTPFRMEVSIKLFHVQTLADELHRGKIKGLPAVSTIFGLQ
jgi:hypothetical protein